MCHGVILLPGPDTTRTAIFLSEEFRGKAAQPPLVLGNKTNQPHISLFHLMLDPRQLPAARVGLRAVARAIRERHPTGFWSRFDRIELATPGSPWMFWRGPENELLIEIHNLVVDAFAHLRSGPVEISWPMGEEQRALHAEYGYPGVKQKFDPHLTIGMLAGHEIAGFAPLRRDQEWKADSLALAELGERGEVMHIIDRIPLSS